MNARVKIRKLDSIWLILSCIFFSFSVYRESAISIRWLLTDGIGPQYNWQFYIFFYIYIDRLYSKLISEYDRYYTSLGSNLCVGALVYKFLPTQDMPSFPPFRPYTQTLPQYNSELTLCVPNWTSFPKPYITSLVAVVITPLIISSLPLLQLSSSVKRWTLKTNGFWESKRWGLGDFNWWESS